MRSKITVFVVATAFSAASVSGEPAQTAGASQVKTAQQIRCELLDDCKPLPTNRAWIDPIGRNPDRTAVSRTGNANVTDAKPAVTKPARPGKRGPAIVVTPVKSSDLFINFASGSSEIDDIAFEQANELYSALTPDEWGRYRFEIAGHTDSVGSAGYNAELSQKRAQAVVDLLIARGIQPDQLQVKGYGFKRPIEGIARTDGRNRRVEIIKLP